MFEPQVIDLLILPQTAVQITYQCSVQTVVDEKCRQTSNLTTI